MAADQTVVDAVLRKLNVTWEDETTEARVNDVIGAVSPALALRLGLDAAHEFAPASPTGDCSSTPVSTSSPTPSTTSSRTTPRRWAPPT